MRIPPELRCQPHGEALTVAGGDPRNDAVEHSHALVCPFGCRIPVVRGIPRFVESDGYASGFGLQWKHFRRTQLDSYTGTTISRDRLARCLGGSLDIVRGKTVLEAGCGAGRFTELLVNAGARVVATDLSVAVEANFENCARDEGYFVFQGDLRQLPVVPGSFDVVLCLGVVQHTPSPEETIAALVSYVKPGGMLVIDHYSHDYPLTPSRRALRNALLALPPARAKQIALGLGQALVPLHKLLWRRARGFGRLRRYVSRVSPLVDYYDSYPSLSPALLAEWAVLDTHDALTDYYKHFRSPAEIATTLNALGLEEIVVAAGGNGVEAHARRSHGADEAIPAGTR
ncbi:MAG TPA: methyltransferase domain-containing protein [Gemmatimonadaceae bacterium]|nr:methyltransferase domain-containing protein [Gemmatimonadaceae bacterium]